jgi:hypothetical protein
MSRGIAFFGLSFCLLFMNSCAGGALVTITAFGVEVYEEARVHRPDLKLEPLSNYVNFSSDQPTNQQLKTIHTTKVSPDFGFDCSKLSDKKKQSKCFNDFSKALANDKSKILKKKGKTTTLQKVAQALKEAPANLVKKLSPKIQRFPASYIHNWVQAWEKKDINTYLSFYSNEFKGSKNHPGAWEASRQRAFTKHKNISIKLSDIRIQEKSPSKFEVSFFQEYKSDKHIDFGVKELIVEKQGTDWKIIKETWTPANKSAKNSFHTPQTKQVIDKFASWLGAWENREANSYISFYSNEYKGLKSNHAKWRNNRIRALETNTNISIQTSNLQIAQNENRIELNFIQKFNSNKYSDIGIKELVWIKTGSNWEIFKESWISS